MVDHPPVVPSQMSSAVLYSRPRLLVFGLWAILAFYAFINRPSFQLGWDSFGYYLYLPATFIHNDPFVRNMSWVEDVNAKYQVSTTLYQFSKPTDGPLVIRYPIGLAVIWLPWFGVGHFTAGWLGYAQDGFSLPYQLALSAGVMLYFLLGLLLLYDVLHRTYDARAALFTVGLVVLGTNLLDQSLTGQTMPHLPLFTVYAAVLWCTIRWRRTNALRDAILLAVVIGIGALIRPTEIVCILIPLFWPGSASTRWLAQLWQQRRTWVVMAAVLVLIGMIQFTYWKLACGSWLIDSYANPGEGLDLLAPHTVDFLFSFRKGWYVYTPLMLIATGAILLLWSPPPPPPLSRSPYSSWWICMSYRAGRVGGMRIATGPGPWWGPIR